MSGGRDQGTHLLVANAFVMSTGAFAAICNTAASQASTTPDVIADGFGSTNVN
jgi:hypothetical protein